MRQPEASRPLVSIVTPSYNYGRYLPACLESVRSQTYTRIEHVVMDACSTDETRRVLETYAPPYPVSIRIERDRGQADAINKGFSLARGDVLCWLNADDFYLHPGVIAEAVAVLESSGADVVAGGAHHTDEHGAVLVSSSPDPETAVRDLPYLDTLIQPATFWRRGVHRELRTDLSYAFDWQLFVDMLRAGARFRAVDARWAGYRLHGSNKSTADPARRRREIASVLRGTFGWASPQHLWAELVYAGVRASELTRSSLLRRAVLRANQEMGRWTRGRVYSC